MKNCVLQSNAKLEVKMDNQEKIQIINTTRTQEFSARARELTALEKRFGPAVSDVILEERKNQVEKEWQAIGKASARNDIQGLLDTLWKWVEEIGFQFTYERTDNTVKMNVTYCPIAEMAKQIGMEEWGYKCYCCDDDSIVRGFNNKIKFSRTKTLMQGHDYCDHTYTE